MATEQKRTPARILAALALFAAVWALDLPPALYLVPYLAVGWDVLREAWENLRHGEPFDECFLMTLATVAAFAVGEYPEATAVMLFYQAGELLQDVAADRVRDSIGALMDIAPAFANLETEGGVARVAPDKVEVGAVIVVRAGERVPLDGVVLTGESFLDASALTGEAIPRRAGAGDAVYSGCVNGEGTLRVRVTKPYADSTVARILDLVENASEKKARFERFITRFARVYTPVVTLAAALLALVPPLLFGEPFGGWVRRACVFLIVSCPCALVISVPLAFFGGVGAASRLGVLVKGGNYLEALARCETMVFDKTGTLTRGEFRVTRLLPAEGVTEEELLRAAACAEASASHPVARAVLAAGGGTPERSRLADAREIAGHGVRALWDGAELLAGGARLMERCGVAYAPRAEAGTVIYVAHGGRYLGCLVVSDMVKDGAAEALRALKDAGVRRTVLLTGDRAAEAEAVAKQLGVDEVYAELLPADKVARLEEILTRGEKTAFVGDGVNDAPALTRADVGVAMGSLGSDAAIEAADVVLMDDDLGKLAAAVRVGRKTVRVARENVALALAVKGAVLALGALGWVTMWLAVFSDVGVALLAVANATRCLRVERG